MRQYDTDLLNAAAKGDLEAVNKALNEGADVNVPEVGAARKVRLEYSTVEQDAIPHFKQELGSDAATKTVVIDLLDPPNLLKKVQFVKEAEEIESFPYNYTPLHWACYRSHEKNDNTSDHRSVAELLITQKANIDAVDCSGQTPLHWAIRGDNFDITTLLVERGANLDIQDTKGRTALDLALKNRDATAVRYLIKKGAKHISDPKAAFRWAVYRGFIDIVEHLLNIYKDTVKIDELDQDGKTALDLTIKYATSVYMIPNHRIMAGFLIEKGAKHISDPQEALRYAAFHGFTGIVKHIWDNHALDINYVDVKGKTALDFSLENSYFHISKFLLHCGAARVSNHNIDRLNTFRSYVNNNYKTNIRYGALASITSAALLHYASNDCRYQALFSCIALIASFYTSIDVKSKTAVMTAGYMASSALFLVASQVDERLSIALKISAAVLSTATALYSGKESTRDLL